MRDNIYVNNSLRLRAAFDKEMKLAKINYRGEDYERAFYHLERAHILGQSFYLRHLLSHYWMFKVGIRRKDGRETIGQIFRIFASVGSLLGWVPRGNTGGANVNPFKPMEIPADLRDFFS